MPIADRPVCLDPARDRAMEQLRNHAERWPELDLRPLREQGLDARDAAMAHAIVDSAVRRWLTLSYIIEQASGRPLAGMQPGLQAALLGASAQVLLLDRVPPYAAINHAVEWAKQSVGVGAGGFANAVLRKVARLEADSQSRAPARPEVNSEAGHPESELAQAGAAKRIAITDRGPWSIGMPGSTQHLPLNDHQSMRLAAPMLPELSAQRLAVVTSLPMGVLRRWIARMGTDLAEQVAMHTLAKPPVIFNVEHAQGGSESLGVDSDLLVPHNQPGSMVFIGGGGDLKSLLLRRPDIWVQDPSSKASLGFALKHIPVTEAGLVLDLCAGQGTKTRQLRAMLPKAKIIASDPDERRMELMQNAFAGDEETLIVPDAQMNNVARSAAIKRGQDGSDVVLLDVPCSNSGVLARRPEARYRLNGKSMESLVELQRVIIARARGMLRSGPGRYIIYSTCSLEQEENQEQVEFMEKKMALRCIASQQLWPAGRGLSRAIEPGDVGMESASTTSRGTDYADGSFVAVMMAK